MIYIVIIDHITRKAIRVRNTVKWNTLITLEKIRNKKLGQQKQ